MEIRNELRYRLAVALWDQMAANGRAVPAQNCLGIALAIPAGVWYGFVAKKDGRRRMKNG